MLKHAAPGLFAPAEGDAGGGGCATGGRAPPLGAALRQQQAGGGRRVGAAGAHAATAAMPCLCLCKVHGTPRWRHGLQRCRAVRLHAALQPPSCLPRTAPSLPAQRTGLPALALPRSELMRRGAANIPWVDCIPQQGLNVYSILQVGRPLWAAARGSRGAGCAGRRAWVSLWLSVTEPAARSATCALVTAARMPAALARLAHLPQPQCSDGPRIALPALAPPGCTPRGTPHPQPAPHHHPRPPPPHPTPAPAARLPGAHAPRSRPAGGAHAAAHQAVQPHALSARLLASWPLPAEGVAVWGLERPDPLAAYAYAFLLPELTLQPASIWTSSLLPGQWLVRPPCLTWTCDLSIASLFSLDAAWNGVGSSKPSADSAADAHRPHASQHVLQSDGRMPLVAKRSCAVDEQACEPPVRGLQF